MIHPTAIITGDVTIDESAIVEPYAVITGPATIREDAYIGAHAVIGAPAQHAGAYPSPVTSEHYPMGVMVGRGACIREYVTIHQGTVGMTIVGRDAHVMAYSHIAHDCVVGAQTTLGSSSLLGGFTFVGSWATFGQGVVTHPWTLIGGGSMVGLNSSVIRDVAAFDKVAGSPAKSIGTNRDRFTNPRLVDLLEIEIAHLEGVRDESRAGWDQIKHKDVQQEATN